MKNEAEDLCPESIIKDALEIGRKYNMLNKDPKYKQKKEKVIDTVNNTQEISRQVFVSNLSKRKFAEVHKFFEKQIDECNGKAEKILQKNLNQALKCKNDINVLNQKNSKLNDELTEVNTNCKRIDQELKNKTEIISQLQMKFTLFEKVKPLLEELMTEFPNEDPLEIINEIRNSKEKNLHLIMKMNQTENMIKELEKQREEVIEKITKNQQEMQKKLDETNYDSQGKIDKYIKEIKELENEAQTFNNFQKGNIRINGLLYNLYSGIISKIQKDKMIIAEKKDHSLNMTKENFNAEIFDNKNLRDLINDTILKNTSKGKGCALLRQTIAFSNMMVRKFLATKEYLRFDLVNTFKEIKNLNDKQEFDTYKLKCIIQSLKESEQKNKQTIKELKNEVKLRKLKYNSLMNKVNRQLKIENKELTKSVPDLEIQTNKKRNEKKRKKLQTEKEKNETNKKFFITSQNFKKKNEITIKNEKIRSANLSFTNRSESKVSDESSDENVKFEEENKKNELKQKQKMLFTEKDFRKFKDIKISKNQDKLIKSNGFKGIGAFIAGIKNIVENTNRIYYYQNKIEQSMPKNHRPNSTMGPTTHPTQQETNCETVSPEILKYSKLSKRVIGEIDALITNVKNTEY